MRASRKLNAESLIGQVLDIDGFNLLTSIEAALAGGVLLRGRDGCLRDMASMHGSYRTVEETLPALQAIGQVLASLRPVCVAWWWDRPVSNSGRVSRIIADLATQREWPWQTHLVADPDRVLRSTTNVVVSSDSVILDHCSRWTNLAATVVERTVRHAWIVPFDG